MDKPSSSNKSAKAIKRKERGKKKKKEEVGPTVDSVVLLSVPESQTMTFLDEVEILGTCEVKELAVLKHLKSRKAPICARHLLPEDQKQQEQILCILKALREQCVEEGGAKWEIDDGIRFIHRVKVVYQFDPRGYLLFLHLLEKFSIKERTLKFVVESVDILFQNSPELLEEFKSLLPGSIKGVVPSRPPDRNQIRMPMEEIISLNEILMNVLPKEEYDKVVKVLDDKRHNRISEDEAWCILKRTFGGNKTLMAMLCPVVVNALSSLP